MLIAKLPISLIEIPFLCSSHFANTYEYKQHPYTPIYTRTRQNKLIKSIIYRHYQADHVAAIAKLLHPAKLIHEAVANLR